MEDNLRNYPYFIVKVHQVEMLRDRGFPIPEHEQWYLEFDDRAPSSSMPFRDAMARFDAMLASSGGAPEDHLGQDYRHGENRMVMVRFVKYTSTGTSDKVSDNITAIIGEAVEVSKEAPPDFRLVMISPRKISHGKTNLRSDLPSYNIQYFEFKELYFNITKHSMVPRHEIITPLEKHDLSAMVPLRDLPGISSDDKVIKYLGGRVGDVVRILREDYIVDTTAQSSVIYREVRRIDD